MSTLIKKRQNEQYPCLDCHRIFTSQSDMIEHWKICRKGKQLAG